MALPLDLNGQVEFRKQGKGTVDRRCEQKYGGEKVLALNGGASADVRDGM